MNYALGYIVIFIAFGSALTMRYACEIENKKYAKIIVTIAAIIGMSPLLYFILLLKEVI